MKFVKSNLAKKLIIILIAIMIFNFAVPPIANADIITQVLDIAGGILYKPFATMILSFLVTVNGTLSLFLCGVSFAADIVELLVSAIQGKGEAALESRKFCFVKTFYWTRYYFFR